MGKIKFISKDIMKFGDPLRTELGYNFAITAPATPEVNIDVENKLDALPYLSVGGVAVERATTNSDKVEFIQTNPIRIRPIDNTTYTPNFIIPFRMLANAENVYGDTDWNKFFTGGSFGDTNYSNLLGVDRVYNDTAFQISIFDKYRDKKTIESLSVGTGLDMNLKPCSIVSNYLDYDNLVQSYQNWSSELSSELLIPNINIITEYVYSKTYGSTTTRIKNLQQQYSKNKATLINYHFPDDDYYEDLEKNQYFGEFFINYTPVVDTNDVIRHQQNLMYDDRYFTDYLPEITELAFDETESNLYIDSQLSTFYNININFERDQNVSASPIVESPDYKFSSLRNDGSPYLSNSTIVKTIENNNFSAKFLELLKDIDEGNIPELTQTEKQFNYQYDYEVPNYDVDGEFIGSKTIHEVPNSTVPLKTINMLNMLAYAYNNPESALNDNFTFLGYNDQKQVATFLNDTLHRTLNSRNKLKLIDSVLDLMGQYFTDIYNVTGADIIGEDATRNELSESVIEKIYGANYKFEEVLAYKIEKKGTGASNDSSEQNIIQKFWVFNSTSAPENISITDSQVKYGKEYEYTVYAYVCVLSHKYRYNDFRLTKQIGAGRITAFDGSPTDLEYCVEFYDPITNERKEQVFSVGVSPEELATMVSADEQSGASNLSLRFNQFATSQVDVLSFPQAAEFNLYLEPCLEIIEVPLLRKKIKVLDNPPNQINVVPFHFIDQSNRVGFKIGQDSFIEKLYPTLISQNDLLLKSDYLKSKELIVSDKVNKMSESPARYIEMYRINDKPNSFADFENSLVSRMDLRIKDDYYNYLDYIAADQILTNTKYYYVFRLVNENGLHGPLSQIIECELVNDGGYVYALFDTISSADFNPDKTTKNTTSFKKLMQLEPNLNQLSFDLTDVDLTDTAINQISNLKVGTAENKIWNEDTASGSKKFKIRLTSKKTDKKLDLNVRFNLRNRDLTKPSNNLPTFDSEPTLGASVPQSPELDEEPEEL